MDSWSLNSIYTKLFIQWKVWGPFGKVPGQNLQVDCEELHTCRVTRMPAHRMVFHCWWYMDYDHLLSLYLCSSSQLSAAWSQWVPRGGLCSSALQGRAREAKMTDVDRAVQEKQNRLSTAVEALHSQPWVALARQGWFLIKNFNYNSVIENRKEHIGPSLIQNSQTTASMAYSHFSGGDHALDPIQ